jgi:hypothetical protein
MLYPADGADGAPRALTGRDLANHMTQNQLSFANPTSVVPMPVGYIRESTMPQEPVWRAGQSSTDYRRQQNDYARRMQNYQSQQSQQSEINNTLRQRAEENAMLYRRNSALDPKDQTALTPIPLAPGGGYAIQNNMITRDAVQPLPPPKPTQAQQFEQNIQNSLVREHRYRDIPSSMPPRSASSGMFSRLSFSPGLRSHRRFMGGLSKIGLTEEQFNMLPDQSKLALLHHPDFLMGAETADQRMNEEIANNSY